MSVYERDTDFAPVKTATYDTADGGDDDDWETDADFENTVGEEGQRWGSVLIDPTKVTADGVDMSKIKDVVLEEHEQNVRSLQHGSQKDRYGGGKD